MMSLYVSSEICLWRLWDLSCFQILSMNLSSTQTTVRAANRFGVGFSPGRTHVSGNARGNVSRVVTWLMIGPLVELRLDLFYIEIRIVTLCNLICLEFIVCKCRFCSEFVSLSICVASCTKSCRRPSVRTFWPLSWCPIFTKLLMHMHLWKSNFRAYVSMTSEKRLNWCEW